MDEQPEQLKFDLKEPEDQNQLKLPFSEEELRRLGLKKEEDEANRMG